MHNDIVNSSDREIGRNNILHKHFRWYKDKSLIPTIEYDNNQTVENFMEIRKLYGLHDDDVIIVVYKNPTIWFESITSWARKNDWRKSYDAQTDFNMYYTHRLKMAHEKLIFVNLQDLFTVVKGLNFLFRLRSMGARVKLFRVVKALIFKNNLNILQVPRSTKREVHWIVEYKRQSELVRPSKEVDTRSYWMYRKQNQGYSHNLYK